jgi:regulator of replication initiation timing
MLIDGTPRETELFEDRKALAIEVTELRSRLKSAQETIAAHEDQWVDEHV